MELGCSFSDEKCFERLIVRSKEIASLNGELITGLPEKNGLLVGKREHGLVACQNAPAHIFFSPNGKVARPKVTQEMKQQGNVAGLGLLYSPAQREFSIPFLPNGRGMEKSSVHGRSRKAVHPYTGLFHVPACPGKNRLIRIKPAALERDGFILRILAAQGAKKIVQSLLGDTQGPQDACRPLSHGAHQGLSGNDGSACTGEMGLVRVKAVTSFPADHQAALKAESGL
jgi:hypothetical protein